MSMSLAALARDEIVKREQPALQRLQRTQVIDFTKDLAPQHGIAESQVESLANNLLPLATQQPMEGGQGSTALDNLIKYIPTEAVTLYLATVSFIASLEAKLKQAITPLVFWLFVALTPLLFLLIYIGKRRSAGLKALPDVKDFPWWKLIASIIAFSVWALAVPGGPYLSGTMAGALAAFLALFVSTFLSVLEPVFERPASA
jgi:hypothetical protein